jgi:hypothetical protein
VSREVWPGEPFPLGPLWDGSGTNFALFTENAERVELCLFHDHGEERIEMHEPTAFHWHRYVPGVGPGQRYGYRVHGRYDPIHGRRFNPSKLLIDPYAKAIDGVVDWDAANVLPYVAGSEDADLVMDYSDSAAAVPKSIVADRAFDWEDDEWVRPHTPWYQTVIYEAHVKGFTKLRLGVREDLRGSYGGLASEDSIAYLKSLGVTAVELLPVHHIIDEGFLHERGLTNYWGYSSIGYFAPHSEYSATGEQVLEFKGMVKALHRAGIEVILDVVYNHTAEGNHLGPMLSFRGVDNESYYRLVPDSPRYYMDYTGTGNTLNPVHPTVLRLIMDSLRYWVVECHVASTSLRRWRASSTRSTASPRSSTSSTRTRSSPRSSSSPSRGTSVPAVIRSGTSRFSGPSGTASTAIRCATSGAGRRPSATSLRVSAAPPISTRRTAAVRSHRSTSSPRTTASRCATSSRSTKSTTRRTARATGTGATTTDRGTAAAKARRRTRR